jgi:hypothetical protein
MARGTQGSRFYCCSWNSLEAVTVLFLLVMKVSSGFSLSHVGSFIPSALKSGHIRSNTNDHFHRLFPKGFPKDRFQLSSSTVVEDVPSVESDEDFISMYSNNESLNETPIETKVGVLLLNLGGPEKTADVQGK